jgi:hypothetical protein
LDDRQIEHHNTTPSPVFIHSDWCEEFHKENEPPEILFGPPLSIRAYDADHQMIYPLTDVAHGKEALDLVERAFAPMPRQAM